MRALSWTVRLAAGVCYHPEALLDSFDRTLGGVEKLDIGFRQDNDLRLAQADAQTAAQGSEHFDRPSLALQRFHKQHFSVFKIDKLQFRRSNILPVNV